MNHPITPSLELVQRWNKKYVETACSFTDIANEVSQWGADQELEACAEWLDQNCGRCWELLAELRVARRPKPPSLKEQALETLAEMEEGFAPKLKDLVIIRHALEALPND